MDRRLKLQQELTNILGSNNVYFQPPPTVSINYPCIIYERESGDSKHADNSTYSFKFRYKVTYIGRKPENDIVKKILELPMCRYDRFYAADGLNHDVFSIYY